MKRLKHLCFVLMLCVALMFSSCDTTTTPENTNTPFTWSLTANAEGEGYLVVAYPTGNLSLSGLAKATATTSNDTVAMFTVPDSTICYTDVLASPSNYSEDEVKLANEVQSAIHVDSMTGTWKVDIVGYARYGQIYMVIDEHWPKDTTQVVDSVTVE